MLTLSSSCSRFETMSASHSEQLCLHNSLVFPHSAYPSWKSRLPALLGKWQDMSSCPRLGLCISCTVFLRANESIPAWDYKIPQHIHLYAMYWQNSALTQNSAHNVFHKSCTSLRIHFRNCCYAGWWRDGARKALEVLQWSNVQLDKQISIKYPWCEKAEGAFRLRLQ